MDANRTASLADDARSSHVYHHASEDPSLNSDLKRKARRMAIGGAALAFFACATVFTVDAQAWEIATLCACGLAVAVVKTFSLYKSF